MGIGATYGLKGIGSRGGGSMWSQASVTFFLNFNRLLNVLWS